MSVINQMLKELEQRKTPEVGDNAAVLPISHSVTDNKSNWIKIAILMVLVTILIVAIFMMYRLSSVEEIKTPLASEAMNTEPVIAEPVIAEQAAKESIDEKVVASVERIEPGVSAKEDKVIEQAIQVQQPEPIPVQKEQLIEQESVVKQEVVAKPEPINNDQPKRVVKSQPQVALKAQAVNLYKSARREVKANQLFAAIKLLSEALEKDPSFHKARILLQSLLLQKQQIDTLEKQLTSSLHQWPDIHEYRQIQARLLLQQGAPEKALLALQSKIPSITVAPDFHALLAYAAQQAKNDLLAVKHYQLLLAEQPGRADWWLGLAVSQERLGNNKEALSCYRQSVGRPGLSQSILKYAKQRIKALQGF
ncbi:MAG: hypothetical protein DRQ47_00160 [Gammaproteobacteria bacterium]|nr:MAG: hypothetical protein DRQ47_00160 [Gammaproteobacteria bacterium]